MRTEIFISKNIQFLKTSRNYTREQLAGMIEVKTCALSAWLDGRARPKIEELIKIADHFDITIDVLVRTDMKRWYVARSDFKLERIVEQGPKLIVQK